MSMTGRSQGDKPVALRRRPRTLTNAESLRHAAATLHSRDILAIYLVSTGIVHDHRHLSVATISHCCSARLHQPLVIPTWSGELEGAVESAASATACSAGDAQAANAAPILFCGDCCRAVHAVRRSQCAVLGRGLVPDLVGPLTPAPGVTRRNNRRPGGGAPRRPHPLERWTAKRPPKAAWSSESRKFIRRRQAQPDAKCATCSAAALGVACKGQELPAQQTRYNNGDPGSREDLLPAPGSAARYGVRSGPADRVIFTDLKLGCGSRAPREGRSYASPPRAGG